VIAYYEGETKYTPAHLVPRLSRALGISINELLGLRKQKSEKGRRESTFRKRIEQVEKLSPTKQRQVVEMLDAFLKAEKDRR